MTALRPSVWTIAGSDPSGGAGVQMDLRLLNTFELYVGSVITAVTAQSLVHFSASTVLAPDLVTRQINALAAAPMPAPRAIKIGMLGSAENARVIGAALAQHRAFVVLDPVTTSTSGGTLADASAIAELRLLLRSVDLLTPNVPEAESLLGASIRHVEDMPAAAAALRRLGAKHVLIKGGHLGGPVVLDFFQGEDTSFWLSNHRLGGQVRGTGCALASAIAAYVALGHSLAESLILARARITHGFAHAQDVCPNGRLLGDLAGALMPDDMPWLNNGQGVPDQRPLFPSCGPEPLGFYPVVDSSAWVKRCGDLGVTTIQLRVKDLSGGELRREIRSAIDYCAPRGIRLFINDYWDLALEMGAYGVHLGQSDLDPCDLRQLAAANLRLGISTHSYDEAARAHALRPSYIALGPIFETTSKDMPFAPQGMARIAEWQRLWPYPLVAIGGLTVAHAAEAMRRGANGVACISDVTKAADPERQIRRWLNAVTQGIDPVVPSQR